MFYHFYYLLTDENEAHKHSEIFYTYCTLTKRRTITAAARLELKSSFLALSVDYVIIINKSSFRAVFSYILLKCSKVRVFSLNESKEICRKRDGEKMFSLSLSKLLFC